MTDYSVCWYFRRGRRGELLFSSLEAAAVFAEGLKRSHGPLVIVTQLSEPDSLV